MKINLYTLKKFTFDQVKDTKVAQEYSDSEVNVDKNNIYTEF